MAAPDSNQVLLDSIGGRAILTIHRPNGYLFQSRADARRLIGMVFCLLAAPAFAEVSEKILSVRGMWVQAFLIGCVAILAGRFRWWLGLPFMVLPIVIALAAFGRRHTPGLGPDIVKEQGEAYFLNFYASALLAAFLVGAGIWIGWRRRKRLSDHNDIR